ncbi:hypothetical protein [Leucobacter denitrificans]|uniref:hypothetical protein n=1 Tax=Leucobacter denitrificans TaxID=683042 RepID=UPI0031B57665
MGFWGRRSREANAAQDAADTELSRKAQLALVAADERIRVASDELAFATAELGDSATANLKVGLDAVREHMTEAFQLHQLNHDHIPDTADELRTRNARIVQLCEWAESVLDERTTELKERVERVRRAPETLARVRATAEALRSRLPDMQGTLERLAAMYSPAALQRVRLNADDAEQLLDFAVRSADLSERRRASGKLEDANLALEAATETLRRAESIFDSIDGFEIEALRTQTTLADVIEDSRGDLVAARTERRTPEVEAAIERLDAALAEVSGSRQRDPFADLALVSAANAALDEAREKAAKPVIPLEHVRHAISAADHSIGIAAGVIDGHRGWIGADARTRLSEARRIRSDISALPSSEGTREEALRLAHRSSALAEDALSLAQRDIDSSRNGHGGGDWGNWGGRSGRSGGAGSVLGPVIGGVILGGLLDDIFD